PSPPPRRSSDLSMAWAAAVIGIWTCVAPWVVAGDVAHTRSITSNLIAGAVATLIALAAAFTHYRTGHGTDSHADDGRTMAQGRYDR
ncbi:SPW repeat protein, partial [Streptomyces sp. NPDC006333]|uniref:SPW repeat protein n=1 Tax=Streptomyces sp. NPDC006333 TaxID=3156753 RepID=UPI0033AFF4D8